MEATIFLLFALTVMLCSAALTGTKFMKIWKREVNLAFLEQRSKGTMMEHLGIEFTEIGEDYLMARMPIDHRTKQPIGIMHGGASCTLAETVGSTAANCCVVDPYYCVGLDINVNHIRTVRSGWVIATTRPYSLSYREEYSSLGNRGCR